MPPHVTQPVAGPGPSRMSDPTPVVRRRATAAAMSEGAPSVFETTNAIMSTSKRPMPSGDLPDTHQHKKVKETGRMIPCVVCGRAPHHLVKDCPVVAEGPRR